MNLYLLAEHGALLLGFLALVGLLVGSIMTLVGGIVFIIELYSQVGKKVQSGNRLGRGLLIFMAGATCIAICCMAFGF